MAIVAAIAIIDKPEVPLYEEEFSELEKAQSWLKYQIPSLPIEKLKVNSRMSHGDTYSVSLKSLESLPEVAEEAEKPAKRKPAEPES